MKILGGSIKGLNEKYKAAFFIGIQYSLEYRFDFFVGVLSTLFPILIQVFLWHAIYGGTGQDVMYGYNFAQMLAYVAIAGAVGKFVVTGIENIVNDDIHSGGLSAYLIKPVGYVPFRLLQAIGQKFAATVTILVFAAVSIAALSIAVGFEVKPGAALLFIPALLLALLLNSLFFFIVSVSAFVLTEVGRFFHALRIAIMVASGGVFPITVFGEAYVSVSGYLPFQYTTYFPISVMTGALPIREILAGMAAQILWIAALSIVSGACWRGGLKRYIAVGG